MTKDSTMNAEKYSNEEEYSTVYIHNGEQPIDAVTNLIELLSNNENKENRIEVLKILKAELGIELLIETIAAPVAEAIKATLISACWEANIDCSKQFLFFVELALADNYLVAMEAITVIENITGIIDKKELEDARKKVKKKLEDMEVADKKRILIADLVTILEGL